jgi:hypothetical protein
MFPLGELGQPTSTQAAPTNSILSLLSSTPSVSPPPFTNIVQKDIDSFLQNLNSPQTKAEQNALLQHIQEETQQAATQGPNLPIGFGQYLSFNPGFYAARAQAVPGYLQNALAELNKITSGGVVKALGTPNSTIPFNPTGTIVSNQLQQGAQYLPQAANAIPTSTYATPEQISNPYERALYNLGVVLPEQSTKVAAQFAAQQPSFFINSWQGLANPKTTSTQYALDLAANVAAALPGGSKFLGEFGPGMEAFQGGINMLTGKPWQSGLQNAYGFGVASGPAFELAGMASRAIDPLANALKDIDAKLLSKVITPEDAAAARTAIQANYDQILMRLGRFALRTAPLSSLFGAMNTGAQYMGGQRNPTALATAFGEGYGAGTLLQGAGEVLGPIFKKAGQALLYGLKSDLTGTSLGDMLGINIQKLDSAPSYGETPPEAEVAAAGKPEARMQYVRGYERPDGSNVPGYWRRYASGISDEARGKPHSYKVIALGIKLLSQR